jgi:hypothetical protein
MLFLLVVRAVVVRPVLVRAVVVDCLGLGVKSHRSTRSVNERALLLEIVKLDSVFYVRELVAHST